MKSLLLLPVVALTLNAGAFVNLTFDEPRLSGPLSPLWPGGPLEGGVDDILTGWELLVNGTVQPTMVFSPVGSAMAGKANLFQNSSGSILGRYSLLLTSTFPEQQDVRIRQMGTVPESMTHLWVASAGYVQIFGDEEKIGEVSPELGSWAFIDVSAFKNKDFLLEIRLPPGGTGQARFDVVGFTVPEPSTWALLGVGALGLGWVVKRGGRVSERWKG